MPSGSLIPKGSSRSTITKRASSRRILRLFPLGIFFVLCLGILSLKLIEGRDAFKIVAIGCWSVIILILVSPLEYVVEVNGVLSNTTLALTATTTGYAVLFSVFMEILMLYYTWDHWGEGEGE